MLNVTLDEQYLTKELADQLFACCDTLFYNYDTIRQCKLFGVKDLIYTTVYQGKTSYAEATSWDQFTELLIVKEQLESTAGKSFNFCAIMRYANETIVIKKHRDKEIPKGESICGISLGATRRMLLSTIQGNTKELVLTHGSLYQLLPPTNDFWLHEILPESYTTGVRYSLTFRYVPNAMHSKDIVYCPKILKSGPNKGLQCHCIAYDGKYCGRHK
jgi:alkylated DNA repair dioxygenase AlkB